MNISHILFIMWKYNVQYYVLISAKWPENLLKWLNQNYRFVCESKGTLASSLNGSQLNGFLRGIGKNDIFCSFVSVAITAAHVRMSFSITLFDKSLAAFEWTNQTIASCRVISLSHFETNNQLKRIEDTSATNQYYECYINNVFLYLFVWNICAILL